MFSAIISLNRISVPFSLLLLEYLLFLCFPSFLAQCFYFFYLDALNKFENEYFSLSTTSNGGVTSAFMFASVSGGTSALLFQVLLLLVLLPGTQGWQVPSSFLGLLGLQAPLLRGKEIGGRKSRSWTPLPGAWFLDFQVQSL